MPAWVVMWTLAVAIFAVSKLATWWPARKQVAVGYLLAWPGMDPRAFTPGRRRAMPSEWAAAAAWPVAGAVLLYVVARAVPNPLVQAWVGGIGLVLILHFGLFRLLALVWGVEPVMRAPLRSTSLGDFWGRRWNLAFHELAVRLVYEPARARFGAVPAVMATFLASGLIHDIVISLPAGGGYGLPTLYFLIQGAGVVLERRLKLPAGWSGRIRVALVAWLPSVILFHPWFMLRVIAPFMRAIGAL